VVGALKRAGRLRALGELRVLHSRGLLATVCTFTETNARFFRHFGLPVTVVPMGYDRTFGGRDADSVRDVDVVFLGTTRDARRKRIVADVERKLSAKGIRLVVKDGSPARGTAYGRDRVRLLNKSKVMLNIMRQPWDDPVARMLLAAPNGALLVSETVLPSSLGPFRPGAHFAMSSVDGIVDAVAHYLHHEEERRTITEEAHRFVTSELTMTTMVRRVLRAAGLVPSAGADAVARGIPRAHRA
jgi:hypothetical protein